jgi:hypothetical protein
MPNYRLLFFRGHRLERWEELDAASYREAVEAASRVKSDDRVELWSETGKLATFSPAASLKRLTGTA